MGSGPAERVRHVQVGRLGPGDPEVRAPRLPRPHGRAGRQGGGGDWRRRRPLLLLGPQPGYGADVKPLVGNIADIVKSTGQILFASIL